MENILKTLVAVKNIKGTSFVGVRNYENRQGEVSNQTFVIGINYANLLKNDLKKLKSNEVKRQVVALYQGNDKETVKKAYFELVTSLEKRTATEEEKAKLKAQGDATINRSEAQKGAYTQLANGLKTQDNALFIYGLCVRKTILKKGEYKTSNPRAKTLIKNKIKKFAELRETKYKQFKLGNLETLKLQGIEI